jgi:hypothetical protein
MYITAEKALGKDDNYVLLDSKALAAMEPLSELEKAFAVQLVREKLPTLLKAEVDSWRANLEEQGRQPEQRIRLREASCKLSAMIG